MAHNKSKRGRGSSSRLSLNDKCSSFADSEIQNLYNRLLGLKFEPPFSLDWVCLDSLGWTTPLRELLSPPWESCFSQLPPIYKELTAEFLATFRFSPNDRPSIQFRLAGIERQLSVATFATACGLYQPSEVMSDEFREAITYEFPGPDFEKDTFWESIAHPSYGEFEASRSRVCTILYPRNRLLQKCIAKTVSPRDQSTGTLNIHDLFYLYCVLTKKPCNLVVEFATIFQSYRGRSPPSAIYNGAVVTRLVHHFGIVVDASITVDARVRRFDEGWMVTNRLLSLGPNGVEEILGAPPEDDVARAQPRRRRRAAPTTDSRTDREILLGIEHTVQGHTSQLHQHGEYLSLMMSHFGIHSTAAPQQDPAFPNPLIVVPFHGAGPNRVTEDADGDELL